MHIIRAYIALYLGGTPSQRTGSIYMNSSVPLSEVVSTLSMWIGNLVRLHKSIHKSSNLYPSFLKGY